MEPALEKVKHVNIFQFTIFRFYVDLPGCTWAAVLFDEQMSCWDDPEFPTNQQRVAIRFGFR